MFVFPPKQLATQLNTRDEAKLQYIDIPQYFSPQHNTICLKKVLIYCTLLYTAIYCNTLHCLPSLSCKYSIITLQNDWTPCNPEYTMQFPTILDDHPFLLLPKNRIAIWMPFYQNPVKYCNITIHCNTQYSIDSYCHTPIKYQLLYVNTA